MKYNGHEVTIERMQYINGELGIRLWCEGEYGLEPYATLTRYFCPLPDNMAFIDENNVPGAGKWLEDNGLASNTGLVTQSGYCTYPLYEFTERFFEIS